jgi:hypothetical protein
MIEGLTREEMEMIAIAQAEIDQNLPQMGDNFTDVMLDVGQFTLQETDCEIILGGVELLHEFRSAAECIDDL